MIELLRLLSPRAWAAIGVAALLGFIGVEELRISHLKHDMSGQRAAAARRLASARVDLIRAQVNRVTLEAELLAQNAAVTSLQEQGARQRVATEQRLREMQAAVSAADRRATVMSRPLLSSTPCDRMAEADRRVVEALR